VRYRDHNLTAAPLPSSHAFAASTSASSSSFYNLIPILTAQENVALVTEIAQSSMNPGDALALVDMTERRNPLPFAVVRRRATTGWH